MNGTVREQLEKCVVALQQGTLTEEGLRAAFASISVNSNKKQDLLYLQSSTIGLDTALLGMKWVRDGQLEDGPDDPKDWPYKTVLEAIRDGWRIVSFPNLALLMDESKTFGLGHEFILEKWR